MDETGMFALWLENNFMQWLIYEQSNQLAIDQSPWLQYVASSVDRTHLQCNAV